MAKDPIPTGRIRRTAKVGGLIGGQAARAAVTRAANLRRTPEQRTEALDRRYLEAAMQMVEVLGSMRGAAMKVGQVLSFIDVSAIPPEYRDVVQDALAQLRNAAPEVAFADMRRVLEDDLEQPIDEAFAEFGEEAVAAASIGQVYRARLHDGRAVAVKVQYPGAEQAVRADMQNLGLLLRAAKTIAPGLDGKAVAGEIRERILDETDYEAEAIAHRSFAREWRGHPFIHVPDVVTSLSRRRVIVTEWVEGRSFDEVRELPAAERDRFAEVIYRFFIGSLYRHGHFSADPHPGNYLLMDDGRVAFIDFGMNKKIPRDLIEKERAWVRAVIERDPDRLRTLLAELGYFDPSNEAVTGEWLLDHAWTLGGWWLEDQGDFTVTRELVTQVMSDAADPRSEYWELMRHETVPPDFVMAQRMVGLVFAVCAQLEATANWHRISREFIYGDPPSTPLGEEEAGFFERRAGARPAA
ncbi:MAG TPA: AarF/ABC1/UbiB kinase family protein [Thermoleophilaceae bacterium]|jgi:predicted unusual protein kinase regulating ubiquinone biosynthesis (AarF/ABC1/UbiB family)